MNPIKNTSEKEKNGVIPNNLPHNNEDFEIKIPKKNVKIIAKILVIVLIVVISAPRIFDNISSTISIVSGETKKFSELFPSLTKTGVMIGSFTNKEFQNVFSFLSNNLASMSELLYKRKLDNTEVEIINNNQNNELQEEPIKIIIDKIGIDSIILNPKATDLETLEESLKQGVVRYPKSGLLGENDNIYLFGHSTSISVVRNEAYKALNGLNDLEKGDIIKVQSKENEYLYKVSSVVMEKDSNAIVEFNKGKKILTISTCNTLGSKEDRYIVEANFIISYPIEKTNVTDIEVSNSIETEEQGTEENNETTHSFSVVEADSIDNIPPAYSSIGKVDLTAQIIEIGILDPATNNFIATTTLKSSDKIAFKFVVSNIGTRTAEGWGFSVVLPTNPLHMYHSDSQENLNPREKIEYAIGFDRARASENAVIIVNVDSSGSINEINEDNNIIKKFITILE